MAVYLIGNRARGLLKIGYSENPETRLRALQTGCADPLVILQTLSYGGRGTEKYLHRIFARHRISGEWFQDRKSIRAGFYCLMMQDVNWTLGSYFTSLEILDNEIEKELEGLTVEVKSSVLEENNKPRGPYEIVSAYQTKQKEISLGNRMRCLLLHCNDSSADFRREISYRRTHTNGRFLTRKYLLNSNTYDLKCCEFSIWQSYFGLSPSVYKRLKLLDGITSSQEIKLPYIFRDHAPLFGWSRIGHKLVLESPGKPVLVLGPC